MRVKIEGSCDLLRLEKCLQATLRHFTINDKAQDLLTLHGVNVYFTVRDENGQEIELTDDKDNILEFLVFKDPNKVQRKARKAKVLSLVKTEEANQVDSPTKGTEKKPEQ
jgi:hypothetical protein